MKSNIIILSIAAVLFAMSCSKEIPAVDTISIEPQVLNMSAGDTQALNLVITPTGADKNAITWRSTNEQVVTVSQDGTATAIREGKAVVIAETEWKSALCQINVGDVFAEEVILDITEIELNIDETLQLFATVLPENTTDKAITWASSNNAIATVDANGLVTAIKRGKANITASLGDVQAICKVTVTNPKAPKVGDFYYSDGTWSWNLDETKTVIGVVFWSGDPTEYDETLKKDHPGCINGLVVSISGEAYSTWQANYDEYGTTVNDWTFKNAPEFHDITASLEGGVTPDRLNIISGYNNTKAIEAFNAAPENSGWPVEAVQRAVEYRSEVIAPKTSSDWYLPSVKELHLLCAGDYEGDIREINVYTDPEVSNRFVMNERIALIPDCQYQLAPGTFWSSTEQSRYLAFQLYFGHGMAFRSNKANINADTPGRIRFILAI